ncbi:hypothetical protein GCM10007103_31420 [Salinimicrobium marinum]|uniref:histidine kinase n=1 Tax=Salinimicrobium marinum TaxID=680283 RepID=A0A918SKM9_9FLAO|nr:PAS domain S-box protein [Salinimicrobium marinum]GHA48178.1 hypothetical protein GCM10007103_31420 [Salinimicrobium marinum]
MKSVVPSEASQKSFPEPGSGIPEINFRQISEESPVAIYTCDINGMITYYNRAAANLWGRSPELGTERWSGCKKIFFPDGKPVSPEECPVANTLKGDVSAGKQEILIQRPDGSVKNLMVHPKPLQDSSQKITGVHVTLIDISEQQTQHVRQETLSAIVESSDDAIISKDLNSRITSWNSGAERIFGYKESEVLGKSIMLLIPDSRLHDEDLILKNIRNGRRIHHFETIRKTKNGKEIPVSLSISPVKDKQGKIIGASKIARDVSYRWEVEEKQAMLSAIVESSDDAIVSKDLHGNIMSWNFGAEKIFGYTEEEAIGENITLLIPKSRLAEEKTILTKIRNGEKIDHFETVRRHKTGRNIPVSLTVSPIKDQQGNIIGASKVARDISAQVKAKTEIEKHTRNLEIINSVGKSISENLDLQGILQKVTDATTKLAGAAFGAFFYNNVDEEGESFRLFTLSGAPREIFDNMGMPRHTSVFKPTFAGKEVIRVDDIRKDPRYGKNLPNRGMPSGHLSVVSYLAVPVISKSGTVIGGLLFGHPDSGMFKLEHEEMVVNIAAQAAISLDNSRLFEQVKSLSDKKDEFIALASHELKTPLTTIKGYLQVLSKIEKDQMSELFLNKSLYQVDKLNSLVEDLLNMSRVEAGKLEFNLEVFDLREMLLDIAETFIYSTKNHKLFYDFGNVPAIIEGDKQRIEQAITNLMNNAVKYSPGADKVYLNLKVDPQSAVISVRDEGIGLNEEQQRHLFTRFYRAESTKGISGLGLGLYLTREIIDRHHGKISVKSKEGEGSEFLFDLPLKEPVQRAGEAAE